jgi:Haem-binding domain
MNETVTNDGRSETAPNRGRRSAGIAASGFVLVWAVASLVHLLAHQVSDRAEAPLFPGAEITPSVSRIFSRACINCHSEKTRWPWYSQVAPASWFVESDVKRARKRMNVSRWDGLNAAGKRLLLTSIATKIENREMPPRRYSILHPEATLSADESVEIIEWTRAERRRLREAQVAPRAK